MVRKFNVNMTRSQSLRVTDGDGRTLRIKAFWHAPNELAIGFPSGLFYLFSAVSLVTVGNV